MSDDTEAPRKSADEIIEACAKVVGDSYLEDKGGCPNFDLIVSNIMLQVLALKGTLLAATPKLYPFSSESHCTEESHETAPMISSDSNHLVCYICHLESEVDRLERDRKVEEGQCPKWVVPSEGEQMVEENLAVIAANKEIQDEREARERELADKLAEALRRLRKCTCQCQACADAHQKAFAALALYDAARSGNEPTTGVK